MAATPSSARQHLGRAADGSPSPQVYHGATPNTTTSQYRHKLAMERRDEAPVPPLNRVGDFGGGGMLLAFGLVCGLLESQRSGKGQVVDAAMVDGTAVLTTMMHAFRAMGVWEDRRGVNILDTGAHFYDVFETADGG